MATRADWKGLQDLLVEAYETFNGNIRKIQGSDSRFKLFSETQMSSKIRDLKRAGVFDKVFAGNSTVNLQSNQGFTTSSANI